MDGLTKIIEKIQSESQERCAEVIAQAEKKAQETAQNAATELDELHRRNEEISDEKAKAVVVRALSSVQQQKKQAILKAKSQTINEAIAQAESTFLHMPDKEYFLALSALIKANKQPGEGVLHLNERDLRRAPGAFLAKLEGITLCKEPIDIPGGFVLVYGNIEINATPEALIAEKREELTQTVNRMLFEPETDSEKN
ncbi:MAG TPA: hypothetical protein DDY98_07520 [Ruminococcaceae bacterium]|nr:hypothetical protein [Oscillospiraceae bacterium]